MKATLEKLENNRVLLEIEVEPERVEAAMDRAYRKVVKQVNVPGFRKGRVPRPVLERHYGVEVLYEDALDDLIPAAYSDAVEQTAIEPIDQPHVDVVEFESGKPFRFKAEVQVKPEVKLGEYKGVEVTRRLERVTDESVDTVVERYRESQAQLVVAERENVQEGDFVVIDFEGFVDGQPFQGGAAKGYQLEVGSGQFIPGFEEQLVGASLNQEMEVNVTFPEEYHHAPLAGKAATFKVTVTEIKEKQLPELDDEFAKDVSDKETLAELRSMIRENLEKEVARRADERLRNDVVQTVADRAEVAVPDVLVERELDDLIEDFKRNLMYSGVDPERYMSSNDITTDDLKKEFRSEAERRAKAALVLDATAKSEGISVEAAEVDARIDELASHDSEEQASYREQLNRPEVRERIASQLRVTKTIDFLVSQAQVTTEEVDPTAQPDEEAEAPAEAPE